MGRRVGGRVSVMGLPVGGGVGGRVGGWMGPGGGIGGCVGGGIQEMVGEHELDAVKQVPPRLCDALWMTN